MKVSSVGAPAGLISATQNSIEEHKSKDLKASHQAQSDFSQFHKAQGASMKLLAAQRKKVPSAVLTFGGTKNKEQQVFIGAEMPPYCKVGGVANVMNDYKAFGQAMVLPYYNGKIEYDPATGNPKADKTPEVHQKDGKFYYTSEDLDKKTLDQAISEDKAKELELVAEKTMNWGVDDNSKIALYRVKDTNDYMVYTDATAKMPKPYADNSYSFGIKPITTDAASWQGDSYAKFSKAFTELLPEIKTLSQKDGTQVEFNPETIVCSDQQTALVPHYMAQKDLKGDSYYKGVKPSYVEHNESAGYQGETSKRNMFVDMAESAEQVRAVAEDPDYLQALKHGNSEEYFGQFIDEALVTTNEADVLKGLPANKAAVAANIPLAYADMGYLSHVTTVSEGYAEGIKTNPMVAPNLTTIHAKLAEKGKFSGILNPANDDSASAYKPIPGFLTHFQEYRTLSTDAGQLEKLKEKHEGKELRLSAPDPKTGKQIVQIKNDHPTFEVFKPDMTLAQMKEVKKANKINLFNRLSAENIKGDGRYNALGKEAPSTIHGHIDPKWGKALQDGKDVKLFVGWGRGDLQKGLDTILGAFEKFGKTEEGKNAVLIVGGELDPSNSESTRVTTKLKGIMANKDFEGRVVYVDGFAPGFPMASAADAAVFPSRMAPCELTDFEAMKYFATPIVPDTQGMGQKNFDPRAGRKNSETEMPKATSYKTTHEFMMSHQELEEASPEFKEGYGKLVDVESKKLAIRGVPTDKTAEIAAKNVKNSEKYKLLRRESADTVIVNEIADAMHAKATETEEISQLIYDNHKKLDTTWDGNGALRGGISSKQAYKDKHFAPDYVAPKKSLFKFNDDVYARAKAKVNTAAGGVISGEKPAVDDKSFFDFLKTTHGKVAAGAVAVGLVGSLGLYLSKSKKSAAKTSVASNSDGDTFKSQTVVKKQESGVTRASNKRNMQTAQLA